MRQSRIFAQQDDEAQIDMTPMLDIVFIMLIFFIVSTSFVREAGIEVQRPESQTSTEQSQGAVMVALSASGDIWLDRQLTDIRMVRPSLERLKTEQADLAVVVQADEESSTGQLVKLLDQLRLANVPYSVATRAGEQ